MEKMLGTNVEARIDGDVLTLTIDLSKTIGPSKSGKNALIATTSGNATLPDGARVGVNVYRPRKTVMRDPLCEFRGSVCIPALG